MNFFKKSKETKNKTVVTKIEKNQLAKIVGGVDTTESVDSSVDATKTSVMGQKAKAWMVNN